MKRVLKFICFFAFVASFAPLTWAAPQIVKGFNLVEDDKLVFDATAAGQQKTPAQLAVDQAKLLGANHILLNVRATMPGPKSNEIIPVTPPAARSAELKRMARLINYIHAQGMTVGLRTIFFVKGPNGEFPYKEKMPDGTEKLWWHGNIQPADPNRWFESFRVFIDSYLTVAKFGKAEEFTIGAELYSMTVGIEDQWKEYPYGFPGRWLELLRYVRTKVPNLKVMYDINFTDDGVRVSGVEASGGEFERWRYRIVDLASRTAPAEKKIWNDLTTFWKELDAIGIDMYRSMASEQAVIPADMSGLVSLLRQRSDSFATQIDNAITQISLTLNVDKPIVFKEVGFRSVEKGFVNPFTYAGDGKVNIQHQAAGFQALFASFWEPKWPWFGGFNFWEISLDSSKSGKSDNGFSPVGKDLTEAVFKKYW